ncbi:TonB-dependent receptor [Erythrobacter sp. WH131]|uniref:TonB-dependent receptor n=2 Tax=Erythrobacter ani TaxID=2827235 RepID=A0ABS6SKU4_9SPHN|nr:TonB-dependent receptor [Erythrobacter ani]
MACSSFTVPALAQEVSADDEGDTTLSPDPDDSVIIVTATRRAQDVQDIPIAVTAVSPQQLENQGVDNIQEVTSVAPSFTSSQAQIASGSVVLRIRGVGTTSNNIGFESAVGIFIDGAYQSRPGVALTEFVDIERVEVLRGPQGTLFGRNTSAGALNITTNRPDVSDFEGFVNASYGNFDEISVQGAVNVPIVQDTLAFRLTGAYRERDGFITLVDGDGTPFDDSNDVDQYLVRAQLGWDTESGLRGRLIADYAKSESSCCSPIELYQSPLVPAGVFAAVGLGPTGGNGQPLVSNNPFGQAEFREALDNRVASANFAPIADVDNYGITTEIEFPVSDSADLIFIGSYRKFESMETYDSDFTALDVFDVDLLDLDLETFTAELRLQGEALDGRLNYIIGGYFSDETIDQSVTFALGEDYGEQVGALLFPATMGALGANPLTVFTGIDPAGTNVTNRFQQEAQSYSIFTNNTFELVEGLELTLGARYSWEDKEGSFDQTEANNQICPATVGAIGAGAVPDALVPAFIGLGCFGFSAPADLPEAAVLPLVRTFEDTFNDEELIYTARLGYAFAAPVNIYASFTHGYKSGGINLDTTAAVGGADPTFDSEEVDAYEIGIKSRFLDNAVTLNIAAFHQEFDNFQVLEFTGTAFQTFNVPAAETTGLEIESVIRPNSELTFNAAATILDARYPEDCAGDLTDVVTVVSLCGNDLTNAANVIAIFGGLWEKPINDSTEFFLSGQIRLEGDQRTSTQAIVPPSAAAVAAAGSVQAAVDAAPLIIGDIQTGQEFVNLRAGLRFADGAYSIEGFVNNLTDNVVRGVTFNTTLRGSGAANSRSAFSLQPRTYGVAVRAKF